MSRSRLLLALPFACLLPGSGCDGFDPALYQRALTRQSSDACVERDVPLLPSSAEFVRLDLADYDDSWQVATCSDGQALGNDVFFAVDMQQGQKFHFHVNALDAIDPVLYVVDSCDERVCQPLNAASSCPNDKEHLSFLAPREGRYYIGVDSADPGGGRVELLALSPQCGNGVKEHSEACDDGNVHSGDGCDRRCRIEIPASDRAAQEPNDDPSGGNVLALGPAPSTFRVRGTIESPCDPEVFSFASPEGARVTVRVLDAAGEACVAPPPEVHLDVQLLEGLTPIAVGQAGGDGACPAIASRALRPAESADAPPWVPASYHVRLATRAPADAPPLPFTLELRLEPAPL